VFYDDFSGSSLGPAWTVISRHGEYAQDETECNAAQQVTVANHVLTIATTAQSTVCGDFNVDDSVRHAATTWPYATGDVQWKDLSFTYGTVSIRAKVPPRNTSTWPALWLLGSNCQNTNPHTADTGYDTCPQIGTNGYTEIDMVECFSSHWCQLALNQHNGFPTCDHSPPTDTSWHTFTMVWTPTSITELVDGTSTGCSFTAAGGYDIPSTPMFLIMQTQTGGVGGTPANLPTSFQISSVTVTQP
jgi:beta-glucanase (GH16 family)